MKNLILSLLCVCYFSGMSAMTFADCSGGPLAKIRERQPIRSFFAKIKQNRASSCSSSAVLRETLLTTSRVQSSCSGAVQSSCTSSNVPAMAAPTPPPIYEVFQPPTVTYNVQPTVTVVVEEPQLFGSSAFNKAHASASYRAANQIKGHVRGELLKGTRSSSGVGFSTSNPNPATCLGTPGKTSASCAVVRGPDGWYSTCVK